MGKDCLSLVDPECHAKVAEAWADVLASGSVSNVELVQLRKDGQKINTLVSVARLDDTAGKPEAMLAMVQDITARKDAERAVRERDERLRLAIQHTHLMAWQCDTEMRFNWVYNPRFGTQEGDLLGKTPVELEHTLGMSEFVEQAREVIDKGVCSRRTVKYVHSDGREQYFDQQVEPVTDAAGQAVGIMGTSLDVTERVLAEERHHKSEESFRVMVAHSAEPMLLVDEAGTIECISRRAAEQIGYEDADLVGTNVERFLDWSGKLDMTMRLEDFIKHAPLPARAILRIKKNNGSWCWIDVQASFVNYGHKPEKYILKFQEISTGGRNRD